MSSKEPHGLVRSDAEHLFLGREANLWPGTSRPYVLWLIHMWQQRQGRPAQQLNVRLSSKSPNILGWRISVSSSQLQWSRLVHSIRQLVSFKRISGKDLRPVRWRERGCVSVSKVIFSHATILCYLAPRQFWVGRPLGLMVISAFTFS